MNPDVHIPPSLREISSAIFHWPNMWRNVFYYLVWPEQIVDKPNPNSSSEFSSNGSIRLYSGGGTTEKNGSQNGTPGSGVIQNGGHASFGGNYTQNGRHNSAPLNGAIQNGGHAACNDSSQSCHSWPASDNNNQQPSVPLQNQLLLQSQQNGSLQGASNHKRSLDDVIGSGVGRKQKCIQRDLLEEQIRLGRPGQLQNSAAQPLIVSSGNF